MRVVAAEVEPEKGGGQGQTQNGDRRHRRGDRFAGQPDPYRNYRLSQRDEDHQAVALHEMGRLNPEVLDVAQEWGGGLQPECEPP